MYSCNNITLMKYHCDMRKRATLQLIYKYFNNIRRILFSHRYHTLFRSNQEKIIIFPCIIGGINLYL